MATSDLEARVRRIEDIEAIRRLKHLYASYCDDGYDVDRLAELFLETAVWDGGMLGRFEGIEAIRRFFQSCSKAVPFAIHQMTNEVLDVDGDRGTGRWYLWEPLVFAKGDRAMWLAGRYDDVYRRVNGTWRFETVTLEARMLSPYEQGFAKVRIAEVPR